MNHALTFAAARRHRPAQSTSLLVPGRTCWRIERARKLSWLIDGEQYFSAVRNAMAQAHSTIFIVGWDIDSRVRLVPAGANDGLPDALGDFLAALLASRPQLNAYILSWDFALLFALEREWLTELRLAAQTDRWPLPSGSADLTDVDVAIVRTEPRFEDKDGVFEARNLHLEAIAAAKTSIFAENQYFTSRTIAQALAKTLEREEGPDIA